MIHNTKREELDSEYVVKLFEAGKGTLKSTTTTYGQRSFHSIHGWILGIYSHYMLLLNITSSSSSYFWLFWSLSWVTEVFCSPHKLVLVFELMENDLRKCQKNVGKPVGFWFLRIRNHDERYESNGHVKKKTWGRPIFSDFQFSMQKRSQRNV